MGHIHTISYLFLASITSIKAALPVSSNSSINTVHKATYHYEYATYLYDHLIGQNSNYNSEVPPAANIVEQDENGQIINQKYSPVIVDIMFSLYSIQNVNTVEQKLSLLFIPFMNWTDHRLVWDPFDKNHKYYGVKYITAHPNDIWTPDLTLFNSADRLTSLYDEDGNNRAVITFDGRVNWTPQVKWDVHCPMKMKYFPFDRQVCLMRMGSWVYLTNTVTFRPVVKFSSSQVHSLTKYKMVMFDFKENHDWLVKDTFHLSRLVDYPNGVYQEISLRVIIDRNFCLYLTDIILTCTIFSILSFFAFWIPNNSGERLNLLVALIIALSVYQVISSSVIPSGTDTLPALTVIILLMIFLVNFSVGVTIFNIWIHFEHQKCVPNQVVMRFLVHEYVGKCFRITSSYRYRNYLNIKRKLKEAVKKTHPKIRVTTRLCEKAMKDDLDFKLERFCYQLVQQMNDPDHDLTNEEADLCQALIEIEWDLLADGLDKFCSVLYLIIFLIAFGWTISLFNVRKIESKELLAEINSNPFYQHYNCEYKSMRDPKTLTSTTRIDLSESEQMICHCDEGLFEDPVPSKYSWYSPMKIEVARSICEDIFYEHTT